MFVRIHFFFLKKKKNIFFVDLSPLKKKKMNCKSLKHYYSLLFWKLLGNTDDNIYQFYY